MGDAVVVPGGSQDLWSVCEGQKTSRTQGQLTPGQAHPTDAIVMAYRRVVEDKVHEQVVSPPFLELETDVRGAC